MATTDTYRDIRIDSDRDIEVTNGGDIALTTSRDENIAQSVAINSSDIVRELLGSPTNSNTLQRLITVITDSMRNDPQIDEVISVEITQIDTVNNSITVRVILTDNEEFIIQL